MIVFFILSRYFFRPLSLIRMHLCLQFAPCWGGQEAGYFYNGIFRWSGPCGFGAAYRGAITHQCSQRYING